MHNMVRVNCVWKLAVMVSVYGAGADSSRIRWWGGSESGVTYDMCLFALQANCLSWELG